MARQKCATNLLARCNSNIMRKLLLFILLSCCGLTYGQFTREQMYHAYLTEDMPYWQQYLDQTDWNSLSDEDQLRYLNYEYGWIGAVIDTKPKNIREYVDAFLVHIEEQESLLPIGTRLTYISSYWAYRAKLNDWAYAKFGLRAKNIAEEAVQKDPENPIAVTLVGCVDFYAPSLFGGSKTRALVAFNKAVDIFRQSGDTINNWNYASAQLQLMLCLSKTKQYDAAKELADQVLQQNPDFRFVREVFLPELQKKMQEK